MYSIETKNLTKKFKEKTAVDGVNLHIKDGELFALLGVNGAGKTTTIKMLSAIRLPTDGSITIEGMDMRKEPNKIKEVLNISPQETAIAPNLTVRENLEFILKPVQHGLKMLYAEGSSDHEECIRHNQN